MSAPMSFFETTPLGHIRNRSTRGIDTTDDLLGESLCMFITTFSSTLGMVIFICIVLPWFLITVVVVFTVYFYIALFYQASARELKRIDAVLRSSLYSHLSESLSGLATIRACGEGLLVDCYQSSIVSVISPLVQPMPFPTLKSMSTPSSAADEATIILKSNPSSLLWPASNLATEHEKEFEFGVTRMINHTFKILHSLRVHLIKRLIFKFDLHFTFLVPWFHHIYSGFSSIHSSIQKFFLSIFTSSETSQ